MFLHNLNALAQIANIMGLKKIISAADSMKPNKLKRHPETKHSEIENKPEVYFRRKFDEFRFQQMNDVNNTTMSSKALLTSYQVSHRARSHTRSLKQCHSLLR
jgi:hypothetical protein